MDTIDIGDINLETKKPKNETIHKTRNKEGGWVKKNDGSGKFKWVEGPGKWVHKNDGSSLYIWKPCRN